MLSAQDARKTREVNVLPNIKSAKKRVKVTEAKTMRNRMLKTSYRNAMKKFEKALESGDKAAAQEVYRQTVAVLDKAVARGLIHSNDAARKKSRFALKLNTL